MTYTIPKIILYKETADLDFTVSGQPTYQLVCHVLMDAWRTRVFKMNQIADEENEAW